jgi:hypothetical protein
VRNGLVSVVVKAPPELAVVAACSGCEVRPAQLEVGRAVPAEAALPAARGAAVEPDTVAVEGTGSSWCASGLALRIGNCAQPIERETERDGAASCTAASKQALCDEDTAWEHHYQDQRVPLGNLRPWDV